MIEIQGITKAYGDNLVLDNVSAAIPSGQLTAFIGPNGAGKSTLLSIITRVLAPESGEIVIDGRNIHNYSSDELARKISVLRQNNNLQVRLSVYDLVAFGRYPYSKGRLNTDDKQKINDAIAYMGLHGMEYKFLDELSGGERQRAFIAMVVAQDTDYIFLDEPLNNLDMKHSVEIMRMLQNLCSESGKTVIIVIHDINFASCYAQRILAIRENKIHINDVTENVITEPVLEAIYDMPFRVCEINGDRICVYYNEKHRRGGQGAHHHRAGEPSHGTAPHGKPPHGEPPHGKPHAGHSHSDIAVQKKAEKIHAKVVDSAPES